MTSSDGEETLQQLRTGLPDLVLLDVNMPKMNGFEVLAEMRADPEIAHIPVIILSAARTFTHDVQEGLNLGADDYVIKPFDWRELLARIRAKLRIKQIEDVLRRRNRELSLLPQIGQDLTAPLSVGELAQVVLDRTVPALEATNGHLVIFHTDGNVSHRMYKLRDFNPWTWQKTQRRIVNEGLISYVVATGQGATTENTREDPRWVKTPNDPVRSAISVPLLNRRGVIGVLTLNHHKVGYFNDEHLTLLQALASQAAIAIENAQFHEIEQKRTKDLVALNKLTHSLTLFTRLETMFTQVPETIHEEFDYPIVSMWMKKEDGELHLRSLAGEQNRFSLDLLALAPRQVASTGKPIILTGSRGDLVDKLEISLPETGELQPNANGLDFTKNQSVAAVPLIRKRDFLGVLAVHSSQVNAFQKSDQMMLETLASQMVTTRDRIQLFESVEQEKQRMSAVLNAADDAILLIDAEDRLQLVNPAGKHLFTGIDAKTGYPLPKNAGYNKLIELLAEARQSNGSAQGELTCPDNHTFATLITPVENGGLVVVLLRDPEKHTEELEDGEK
ncbi:MAG: GAF domain-containing protein, partial [Anaerolineales bacterium]